MAQKEVVILTGANAGIGRELCWALISRQVAVLYTCRDEGKIEATHTEITKRWQAHTELKDKQMPLLRGFVLELCDIKSVQSCVQAVLSAVKKEDLVVKVLVNNAGANFGTFGTTSIGLEQTLHGNFLGPYLFTLGLLPMLIGNAKNLQKEAVVDGKDAALISGIRIVNVSSQAHYYTTSKLKETIHDGKDDGYSGFKLLNTPDHFNGRFATYGNSKLFNLWFTQGLQAYLDSTYGQDFPLFVFALHPGVIQSELSRNLSPFLQTWVLPVFSLFLLKTEQGASGMLYLTLSPDVAKTSFKGTYFDRIRDPKTLSDVGFAKPAKISKLGEDIETRRRFLKGTLAFLKKELSLPETYLIQL
jgi:NAD(P)-dependent dehydrogenase (short-subunit alcohol dehydrogenase family)